MATQKRSSRTTSHTTTQSNGQSNGNGHSKSWWQTVVQVTTIPLASALIYIIVQWVTQGDTLKHHEQAIEQNQKDIKDEAVAREKTRTEFIDKLGKLNDSMSTLNTNVAVQGQVLGTIKDELQRRR